MSYMKCLSKCPYCKKYVLPRKDCGCTPMTLILTFHRIFHCNIWVFANLPIYRKLILWQYKPCFEKQESFIYYYFEGDIKLFVHKIFVLETVVNVILKKIYITFIYKYWHYNLCWCYFEEDKNFTLRNFSYLFALLQKFRKDVVPIAPISVITSILLKSHRLSTMSE